MYDGAQTGTERWSPRPLVDTSSQNLLYRERHLPGQFVFDGRFRLVTGEDRSSFLIREKSSIQIPYLGHTSQRRTVGSSDKKFSLVNVSQRHFNLAEFLSYYAWTFLSILLLSWWIAMDLGSPVRKLRLTVERFGQGDLSARIDSKRTDELCRGKMRSS